MKMKYMKNLPELEWPFFWKGGAEIFPDILSL